MAKRCDLDEGSGGNVDSEAILYLPGYTGKDDWGTRQYKFSENYAPTCIASCHRGECRTLERMLCSG